MKKLAIIFLLITISYSSFAQLYKKHDWEKENIFNELFEHEKSLPSLAIKEKYLIQYYKPVIGNGIKLFETKHSIIRVNTDKGINTHNKVYIPMRNVKNIINIKARVLQRNGEVQYLNKKNIKELKDVEGYGGFKIFAIEGITKDSQVEYIYTIERKPSSLGSIVVQKPYEVREAEVIIRKPFILETRLKPYNGFPRMIKKKVEGNKEAYTANIQRIKAMTKEASASPEANRMKVSYQVGQNFGSNLDMWIRLESNIQSNFIGIKPKKHKKLVEDYKKKSIGKLRETQAEIINNICEYVTENFNIIRTPNPRLNQLKTIIQEKQATETGIIKVYSCLFNAENIDYEFVLTSDRFNHKFDSDFYSNSNLQNALFYFIEEGKYIEPDYVNTRLSFAPEETISNNGIFIDDKGSRIKKIDVPESKDNIVQRDFIISTNLEEVNAIVTCNHQLTGYRASNARGAYKYFKNKDLNQFKNFTAVSGIEDAEFDSFEVQNEDFSLSTNNSPIKFEYSYTAESLIEELGQDFILNFGKVIGTQNEFYQEAERINPVELRQLMTYSYLIDIEIPDGYEPKGVEDIKIDEFVTVRDKIACKFISDYTVKDNHILINVTETYNMLHMDLKHYEGYKNVVNAAFDFSNKNILFKRI